ncbi:putative membrane protein [Bacteroides uniformis str. 3978 T3 i]|nr:putative membrane protein [Bacteroides fragilis str. S36L12]KDS58613.1 putative membrane protein [Bacteroides uniformis str. 3978 T3 i]
MQRSPFILYSYYGTILIYIKLVMQIIDNQSFINGGGVK